MSMLECDCRSGSGTRYLRPAQTACYSHSTRTLEPQSMIYSTPCLSIGQWLDWIMGALICAGDTKLCKQLALFKLDKYDRSTQTAAG